MAQHPAARRFHTFAWRCFDRRQARSILAQLAAGQAPACPLCGVVLEARPTRNRENLVLDASGFDLDCRDCRRFWCVVRHTPRSLRLLRMRRLLAAVRAAGEKRGRAVAAARRGTASPVAG